MDIISYLHTRRIGIPIQNKYPIGIFNNSQFLNKKLRFVFQQCTKYQIWPILKQEKPRDFFKTTVYENICDNIICEFPTIKNNIILLLFLHMFYIATVGWNNYLNVYS